MGTSVDQAAAEIVEDVLRYTRDRVPDAFFVGGHPFTVARRGRVVWRKSDLADLTSGRNSTRPGRVLPNSGNTNDPGRGS